MNNNKGFGYDLLEKTQVIRDIEYKKVDQTTLLMNIYSFGPSKEPRPPIIYIHGGAWENGTRKSSTSIFFLLEQGYSIVSIDYRLTNIAPFPAQLEDCKAAVRFIRANRERFNLKTEKIGVCGHSAGGHLASLLGTTEDEKKFDTEENLNFLSSVQAVCNFYGSGSISGLIDTIRSRGALHILPAVEKLIGGTLEEKAEVARQASPVNYVSKKSSPTLLIHGDKDAVVDVSLSRTLHQELLKAEVASYLHIIENAGHGGEEFLFPEIPNMITSFFDRYIKS
ncbi:alpha/beta hydrolase [bacterium]|nr:alpha/beta hydrolase [bacterium]